MTIAERDLNMVEIHMNRRQFAAVAATGATGSMLACCSSMAADAGQIGIRMVAETAIDDAALNFVKGPWGTCINGQTFQEHAVATHRGYQYNGISRPRAWWQIARSGRHGQGTMDGLTRGVQVRSRFRGRAARRPAALACRALAVCLRATETGSTRKSQLAAVDRIRTCKVIHSEAIPWK